MKSVDKFIVVLVILWVVFAISVHKMMSSRREQGTQTQVVQTEQDSQQHRRWDIEEEPQSDIVQLTDSSREEYFADPITLYSGSLENIRQILAAEQKFFDENGKYTENIDDMKLAFQHVRAVNPTAGKVWIYLKNNYHYVLTKELVAIYCDEIRKESEAYHLDFYFDGRVVCVAKSEAAKETCENLGGTNSTQNRRIPSWTMYDLSEDFLEHPTSFPQTYSNR